MDHIRASELEKINESSCDEDLHQKKYFRKQALISLGPFLLSMSAGATSGFPAILIPQLQHNKDGQTYSTDMISWIAATAPFALLFGNLTSGYLMEKVGRKTSHLWLCMAYIVGWVTIGLAENIQFILVGRFITGFCHGWIGPLGPVFVGEISSPIYRGFLLGTLSLCIASGVFISHLLGTFLHWSYASLFCGVFPLVAGFIIYFAPESPTWLASKNKVDRCVASFKWYRGTNYLMKLELEKLLLEQQSTKGDNKSKQNTLSINIKKPEFWKPLCIMIIFFIITQLSGVNVVSAYTTNIMDEILGSKVKKYTYSAMLGIDLLRVVALTVACIILRRGNRRPLAIFSGALTTLSLFILSMYLYLVKIQIIRDVSHFLPLCLIAFYVFVSNLGISILPWNMVGELFASETKGLGSGISVMMTSIAYFLTIKTAPSMFETIGHHGTFLSYGMSTLIGTVFLYMYLPETRNKTLLQIADYFRHSNKMKVIKDTLPTPDP